MTHDLDIFKSGKKIGIKWVKKSDIIHILKYYLFTK